MPDEQFLTTEEVIIKAGRIPAVRIGRQMAVSQDRHRGLARRKPQRRRVVREGRRQSSVMALVIITGASSEATAIEAINLGVNGYLTKPFGVDKVLIVAARALGAAHATSTIAG